MLENKNYIIYINWGVVPKIYFITFTDLSKLYKNRDFYIAII